MIFFSFLFERVETQAITEIEILMPLPPECGD